MGAPYAQDLRDRVLAAYDRGMTTCQIAELFQVSPAWARRVNQRRRETGETAPRPMGGPTLVKIDLLRLSELVQKNPHATLKELRAQLHVGCALSTISMALRRLGLSPKRKRLILRKKPKRPYHAAPPHVPTDHPRQYENEQNHP